MASPVVDIYPLTNYRWKSKEPPLPIVDRLAKIKQLYPQESMRTTVEGVLVMWEHNHPHVIMLRQWDGNHELPGGRIRPGENEIEGLKRKLSNKLEYRTPELQTQWQIGECVGIWWRPNFEDKMYPYRPPHITKPKECRKMFMVHLPERKQFVLPKDVYFVPVPLYNLYNNERFGLRLSLLAHHLSRFKFNMIQSID